MKLVDINREATGHDLGPYAESLYLGGVGSDHELA